MRRRQLTAVILASALITLDGTGTTIALPVIGRELSASMSGLQWIANAPLLAFLAGSAACATATSDGWLIAARLLQGSGGALILPAALAILRGAHDDVADRARVFGIYTAWTGVAAAAGPLVAGALVDLWSWRVVFVPPAAAAVAATLLLGSETPCTKEQRGRVPGTATDAALCGRGRVWRRGRRGSAAR